MIHLNAYIRHFSNCLLTQWPVFSDPSRFDLTPLLKSSIQRPAVFCDKKVTRASQQPRSVVAAAFAVHINDVISHACVATLAHYVVQQQQCGRRWGSTSLWRHSWKPAASNTTEQSVQTEKRVYSYTRRDSICANKSIFSSSRTMLFLLSDVVVVEFFFLLLQLLAVELPMLQRHGVAHLCGFAFISVCTWL